MSDLALPRVLVDPPWEVEERAARAASAERVEDTTVLPGLEPPDERVVVWAPGERAEWAASRKAPKRPGTWWAETLQRHLDGGLYVFTQAELFAHAPDELVRPHIAAWRPSFSSDAAYVLKPVVARFEAEARETALAVARGNAYGSGEALLPFLDAETARLHADWLARLKSAQRVARAWFARHGLAAVPFLVPDALGKRRPARRAAVAALWAVADDHGAAKVVEAARVHGSEAADAIARAFAATPPPGAPVPKPVRPPKIPWLDLDRLPALTLRDGGTVPPPAAANLVGLLALDRLADAEPAVAACTPESLAGFGWALFEAWRDAGEPSRNLWVVDQLGLLGDDRAARLLMPVVREWPGQNGHLRAVRGLKALVAIGTDEAVAQLSAIANRAKFRGLREEAASMLQEVAERRGLSAEQLADRLVPDFGLDPSGSLTLDYGPRRFAVTFDERLVPVVRDASGKIRKSLPKPGAKDDPELAPAAHARFAALKKDVRGVAADQIRRLEVAAMLDGRLWSAAEFHEFVVGHPLMRHLARRLVWWNDREDEPTAFRVAEDGTFADVDDEPYALPDDALVGVPHPLELGGALGAWVEIFADYEILQPFPQLGRPVHALTSDEAGSDRLARFEGVTVPTGKVLGLTRRRWTRGVPEDGGVEWTILHELGDGVTVVIDLDPGIAVGNVDLFPEQTLRKVRIEGVEGFGAIHPVVASELVSDLTDVTRQ
ncbi:DUF4132 domain-containing protein [Spirillospora sp. CA-294931]|uniref:DUF4132 domain-containing protein n=1 Tax=Spirillospora sp. CA-294931 TaxID=3240042 RepID=UPI003D9390C9